MLLRPMLGYNALKIYLSRQGVFEITYNELLATHEWNNFRTKIKCRDKYTCTICKMPQFRYLSNEEYQKVVNNSNYGKYLDLSTGQYFNEPILDKNTPTKRFLKNTTYPAREVYNDLVQLEVHHKHYIWGRLPWEYEMDVLTTLCHTCHKSLHQKEFVIYNDSQMDTYKELTVCNKCGGAGYIPKFNHVQDGVCFECGGLGGLLEGGNKYSVSIQ